MMRCLKPLWECIHWSAKRTCTAHPALWNCSEIQPDCDVPLRVGQSVSVSVSLCVALSFISLSLSLSLLVCLCMLIYVCSYTVLFPPAPPLPDRSAVRTNKMTARAAQAAAAALRAGASPALTVESMNQRLRTMECVTPACICLACEDYYP